MSTPYVAQSHELLVPATVMRILAYPAMMEIGGSQLNCIELAGQLSRDGHEVVLYAPHGELNAVAEQQGLEVVRSPCDGRWPTIGGLRGLVQLVQARQIDVVHAYEWGPSVEAALGPYGLLGVPMITTVLSMDVPHVIPLVPPLIVGTAELAAEQAPVRTTHLAEPWIDTVANRPGAVDAPREHFGLQPDDFVLSIVCRMTSALEKSHGVRAAIEAVRLLHHRSDRVNPVRLLVVGGGEELPGIRDLAGQVNRASGTDLVIVTGPLLDPRAAYDAADVVLGMGSSALKGLSFAKPLIVQGTGGYWEPFGPETVGVFDHQGFFGEGRSKGATAGAASLLDVLDPLLSGTAETRQVQGDFGRRFIESRFSLSAAAAAHLEIYRQLQAAHPTRGQRASTTIRTGRESLKLNMALWRHARRVNQLAGVAAGTTTASKKPT